MQLHKMCFTVHVILIPLFSQCMWYSNAVELPVDDVSLEDGVMSGGG